MHKRQGEGYIQVRLGREDLRILDKVLPFDRVQLLEVLEKRNARVRVALLDNLTQTQQDLQCEHDEHPSLNPLMNTHTFSE